MVACVGGCEDEFAGGRGALRDDAVVIVEGFVDGYEDALGGEVRYGRMMGWCYGSSKGELPFQGWERSFSPGRSIVLP